MYQLTIRFSHGIFKSTSMMCPTFAAALFRGTAEMLGGLSSDGSAGIVDNFTIHYDANQSHTFRAHDLSRYYLHQSDLAANASGA